MLRRDLLPKLLSHLSLADLATATALCRSTRRAAQARLLWEAHCTELWRGRVVLFRCVFLRNSGHPREACRQTLAANIWVKKWCDFSSKYGIGYVLSDGSVGVYFNDATKVVFFPNGSRFHYITRNTSDLPAQSEMHSLTDYPEILKKKVMLLQRFADIMLPEEMESKEGATNGRSSFESVGEPTLAASEDGRVVFVKMWRKTEHALFFQLSDRMIHVVFDDQTEVLLSGKYRAVTYLDRSSMVAFYALHAIHDDALMRRLGYIREVLKALLKGARTREDEILGGMEDPEAGKYLRTAAQAKPLRDCSWCQDPCES